LYPLCASSQCKSQFITHEENNRESRIEGPAGGVPNRGRGRCPGDHFRLAAGCRTGLPAPRLGGKTPQADWLMGQPVGFRGPWGVSYPANLRLTVQSMTEAEWLRFARIERLPPMPWFALRDMSDDDLRALYRFIRTLGPKGDRMPAAVAPNGNVATPFIQFTPQNLPSVSQASQAKPGGRG